jgi:phosphoribosylformylglycinamidine cyclo-ligase
MYPAFNMGIGYIIVVSTDLSESVLNDLRSSGENPYIIGKMDKGEKEVILKV